MKMKKVLIVMLLVLAMLATACGGEEATEAPATDAPTEEATEAVDTTEEAADTTEEAQEEPVEAKGEIILSTTTSTEDSGLLDAILPDFTDKTGYTVKVVAVGTGAALQNGRDGNADVLLVHAKASEEEFVEEGYGVERFDVMYNDFVIVGPEADPAGLKADYGADVKGALQHIAEEKAAFVSRGDDSGTHKKELQLWEAAEMTDPGEDAANEWYTSAGKGMGDVLTMASEMEAYTMTDRATYLAMKDDLDLVIVVEGAEDLFNQYGVIAVDASVSDGINTEGGQAFVDWILAPETQELIKGYGVEEYGEPLFVPNAQ
ncbi:MAG: substrate-binding domain-containing protein [Peptoniphilaceae bacterium]|jgi:tungstate transport system substrate-binding protein